MDEGIRTSSQEGLSYDDTRCDEDLHDDCTMTYVWAIVANKLLYRRMHH